VMTAGRVPVAPVNAARPSPLSLGDVPGRDGRPLLHRRARRPLVHAGCPAVGLLAYLVGYLSSDMKWAQGPPYQYYIYLATTLHTIWPGRYRSNTWPLGRRPSWPATGVATRWNRSRPRGGLMLQSTRINAETWAFLRRRMIRETEAFLDEAFRHPERCIEIPARRWARAAGPPCSPVRSGRRCWRHLRSDKLRVMGCEPCDGPVWLVAQSS